MSGLKRRVKWGIGLSAVLIVLVVKGPYVYIHYIESPVPAPLSLSASSVRVRGQANSHSHSPTRAVASLLPCWHRWLTQPTGSSEPFFRRRPSYRETLRASPRRQQPNSVLENLSVGFGRIGKRRARLAANQATEGEVPWNE